MVDDRTLFKLCPNIAYVVVGGCVLIGFLLFGFVGMFMGAIVSLFIVYYE